MRRGGAGDEPGIADDVRHLGAGRPGRQELGLGAQQRMHPIGLALERDCFVVGGGLAFGEAAAGAHEADRRHHRKAQNRQQQRKPGHVVAVKLRQGRDEHAERRRRDSVVGTGGRDGNEGAKRGGGQAKSAKPRTSPKKAPAGDPDRVRHTACPTVPRHAGAIATPAPEFRIT